MYEIHIYRGYRVFATMSIEVFPCLECVLHWLHSNGGKAKLLITVILPLNV